MKDYGQYSAGDEAAPPGLGVLVTNPLSPYNAPKKVGPVITGISDRAGRGGAWGGPVFGGGGGGGEGSACRVWYVWSSSSS